MSPSFDVGIVPSDHVNFSTIRVTISSKISKSYIKSHNRYENDVLFYHLRSKVIKKGSYPSWSYIGPLIISNEMEELNQCFFICYYREGTNEHKYIYNLKILNSLEYIPLKCYDDMIVISLKINYKNCNLIDYRDVIPINISELNTFTNSLLQGNVRLCVSTLLENHIGLVKKKKSIQFFSQEENDDNDNENYEVEDENYTASQLLMYDGNMNEIYYFSHLEYEEYNYDDELYSENNDKKDINTASFVLPEIKNIWLQNRYSFRCPTLKLT